MKRKFKVLGSVLAGLLVVSLVFGAGVYASQWLNFTGDEQITQSDGHVEEIMDILRQVNEGKISAEEAELRLEGEVVQLTEDKDSLNNQLTYLEGLLEGLVGDSPGQKINRLKQANDDLRDENSQLQTSITDLQGDNEELQSTIEMRDYTIQGLENDVADLEEKLANAPEDQTEYIAHLEAELERANNLVDGHHDSTTKAVQEARTYIGDE